MERIRLLGAAAGAVFSILIAVAFAIAPGPSSAADVKVIDYYTQHGNAAIWQAVLAGFGLVGFVWFVAVFSTEHPRSLRRECVAALRLRETVACGYGAQPSRVGKPSERNWPEMFETARMPLPSARTKIHWSAFGHVTSSQRPSGDGAT